MSVIREKTLVNNVTEQQFLTCHESVVLKSLCDSHEIRLMISERLLCHNMECECEKANFYMKIFSYFFLM